MQRRPSPFMRALGYGYLALFFFAFGFAPIMVISFAYDWLLETTGVQTTGYVAKILPCSHAYAVRCFSTSTSQIKTISSMKHPQAALPISTMLLNRFLSTTFHGRPVVF